MTIEKTLANQAWLVKNEEKVKALFPKNFVEIQKLNATNIGNGLKALGVEWRSEKEFEMIMMFFQKLGFILRDGKSVKQNPKRVF
jgi:hypothetical protein